MIAVTGAGGGIGGRVARTPAAQGLPLRPEAAAILAVLGRPPRSLGQVLREHPECMGHLRG